MTLVERSGGSSSASTDPSPRLNQLTFGGGSPTSRIHIRPGQVPTTTQDGIRFGTDVVLYRSGAETLALTGNLVVSGQITGTGAPLSLSSNNIWTGTNQFTQPVQFSNTVSVSDGGISFTAPGAAATRTALSLVPGTDLQAYDADLQAIAALTKPDGGMMVGDGTNWVLESGATLRTSLGLGTTSAVTFDTLTLAGLCPTLPPWLRNRAILNRNSWEIDAAEWTEDPPHFSERQPGPTDFCPRNSPSVFQRAPYHWLVASGLGDRILRPNSRYTTRILG